MRCRSAALMMVLFPVAFLSQIFPASFAASNGCNRVVGEWAWFVGGKVSFAPGSRALWTPPAGNVAPVGGTWHCGPGYGTYTVDWQNGFTDTLRMSPDHNRLSGTNSAGVQVWGRRIPRAASTRSAQKHGVAQQARQVLQAGVQALLQNGLHNLLSNGGTSADSNTNTSGGSTVCTSLSQNGCWHTLGRGGAGYEQLNQRKGAFR